MNFSDRMLDLSYIRWRTGKQSYRPWNQNDKIQKRQRHRPDELFQNRFETLSWLVAHGRLDVKIALRERGMYHDKVGIISIVTSEE